jgi:hypothetical protein
LGYSAITSRLTSVILAAVLIASITSAPAILSQPPTQNQPQPTATDISQIVKQISERVTSANPGTTAVFVEQILTELARQSSQAPSHGNVLQDIYSQILTYPYGIESQSLARFASLLSSDTSLLLSIVQKIVQEQASGSSPSQSLVNIAVQDATGGGKNVNEEIALAAQIIAKQASDIPLRNIESIIIQMALEISRAQGKAITGQTIFEIASQIKQNPNGVLTQALLQLAKQDIQDNGKTGQTTDVIKTIIVQSKQNDNAEKDNNIGTGEADKDTSNPAPPRLKPPIQIATPVTPKTPGQLAAPFLAPVIDWAIKRVVGNEGYELISAAVQGLGSVDPTSIQAAITAIGDMFLRNANSGARAPSIQDLNNLQAGIKSDPALLHKVGQLAALYNTGDGSSAAYTSDIIASKLVAGVDPAVALGETPIPEAEIVTALPIEAVDSETYLKSLPPSGEVASSSGNDTDIVEPDSPVQPLLFPGPPGESAFYPGLGMLAPQPDSSILPSETALPTEPVTSPVEQSGTNRFFPASPAGLANPAEIECLGSPELCTEPVVPLPAPIIDLCQEQWYLPECIQNGNDLEENNLQDGDEAQSQAPAYNEGGYQQLPYYYEPEGYQEGEDQYSEDSRNEEDDYEGGYQEYEQDYSEEEDSGDEEDDYEEVGGYQEEEEAYSEEEVEQDDGGEEEDFTEEEEESVEYYEE